jgi:hypothetical protein
VIDAATAAGDLADALAALGELAGGGHAGCTGTGHDDEGHAHSLSSPWF